VASSDMCVIVIEGLLLDVLVLSSELLVPQVKVDSSLLECHGLDVPADLVVIISHADGSLSQNHIDCLSNCAVSLILELGVYRKGNLSLRELVVCHLLLSVLKLNDVSCAVLEAKKEARLAFIVDSEIVFADNVSDVIVAGKAL